MEKYQGLAWFLMIMKYIMQFGVFGYYIYIIKTAIKVFNEDESTSKKLDVLSKILIEKTGLLILLVLLIEIMVPIFNYIVSKVMI